MLKVVGPLAEKNSLVLDAAVMLYEGHYNITLVHRIDYSVIGPCVYC